MNIHVDDNNEVLLGVQTDEIDLQAGDTINIGTSDYEQLDNKPSINDVELIGDLSSDDLGLADAEHTHVKADVTDFAHNHTKSEITDFPTLATVATSGNYNDLSNKPTIPEEQIFRVVLTEDEDEEITASESFADIADAYDEGKYITVKFVDMDGYGSDLVLIEVAVEDGYISMRDMMGAVGYWNFVINADESVTRDYLRATTNDLTNNSRFVRGDRAIWEGTCSTGASTSAKAVTLSGFNSTDQDVGVMVVVTFSNTNTATPSGLTLNVNAKGAKPIKCLKAGQLADLDNASDLTGTMPFFYDGTNWVTWYDTSGTNTDENVLQQYQAESGYSYWRPLVIGRSSSGTEGFTPTTYTDQTYVFKTLEVQPSTGTIRMGKASMYQGSYTTKIAPDTLTGNRNVTIPDASGTMALTDDIPTDTSDLVNDSLYARGHIAIFNATCSTAAATAEKAVTCSDFKSADLKIGATVLVAFSETNSAAVADLKLNVNGTGAYPIKQNKAGAYSNLDSAGYLKADNTYPFIFNGTYWITWYNTDTNTIGYNIRTNAMSLPMKNITYRYRILFTSADGTSYVPANTSSSTSATASKTVNQEKIDPHGRIVYYATTASVAAGSRPSTAYQYSQYYTITLGYSFNRTGAALTMTAWKPVYIKCSPQTDGSAIIDSTEPYVQALPTTNDGYIYIFLGVATSATAIEMTLEHPIYYHDGTALRRWTGPVS